MDGTNKAINKSHELQLNNQDYQSTKWGAGCGVLKSEQSSLISMWPPLTRRIVSPIFYPVYQKQIGLSLQLTTRKVTKTRSHQTQNLTHIHTCELQTDNSEHPMSNRQMHFVYLSFCIRGLSQLNWNWISSFADCLYPHIFYYYCF